MLMLLLHYKQTFKECYTESKNKVRRILYQHYCNLLNNILITTRKLDILATLIAGRLDYNKPVWTSNKQVSKHLQVSLKV